MYPKVITAAKAQEAEFETINEGIFLTEDHLQNIETTLTHQNSTVEKLTADLETATQTIADRDATIQTLNTQLEEARKEPAASFEEKDKEEEDKGKVVQSGTSSLAEAIHRRLGTF